MIRLKFFLALLFLGLLGTNSLWAQGSALTLFEGEAGRALISKVIQTSPQAKEFLAGVLGIASSDLTSIDPLLRQRLILTRLNAQGPDQQKLIAKANRFILLINMGTSDLSLSSIEETQPQPEKLDHSSL
ncbi:MAG: hypothetical protein HYW85_06990, partial [Deltaproteobacteria bacterium]|nr:hypothetical protein [Deltaproteobacteria bacterium]